MSKKLNCLLNRHKETLDVIRVEHEDGAGMFNTIYGNVYEIPELKALSDRHFLTNSKERFPTPEEDGIPRAKNGTWFCAFLSLEQFNKIIKPNEAKILIYKGFNILLLTITDFKVGNFQVIYRKKSIIESKCINSLFL